VQNLIRVPGPAGSGKTTLYDLLIQSLNLLGLEKNIVISAQSEYKVNNIQEDLKESKAKGVKYNALYSLISNLKQKNALYTLLEEKVLDLYFKKLAEINKKDSLILEDLKETFGTIEVKKGKDNTRIITFTGTSDQYKGLNVTYTIYNNSLSDFIVDFSDSWFTDVKPAQSLENGLLIIDECTNLSSFEWEALSKIAKDQKASIFATGDNVQRGYSIKITNQ